MSAVMNDIKWNAKTIAYAALLAALYIALTGLFAPIGFSNVQVRISEVLCAVALFTPLAIPGLTVGCLISNILWSPYGILDVLLGTLATFLGVLLTYQMRRGNRILALLPPVVTNALLVALTLNIAGHLPYLPTLLYVGLGEAISCMCLGYLFSKVLDRFSDKLF